MAVSAVSERIKTVRKTLKLSQNDFCKGIFLSRSFYTQIECGTRNPNERIYELISNKYKVNKEWLITGKGEMFGKNPPDTELEELMEIIKKLNPLFRSYITQQIKLFSNLEKQSEADKKPRQLRR